LDEFHFRFLLTAVHFLQIPVFAFWSFGCGVSDIFYVYVSDGAERLPPFRPRRGREAVFHGPALPRVSEIAIRHTYPSWLRRRRFGLLLQVGFEGKCPGRILYLFIILSIGMHASIIVRIVEIPMSHTFSGIILVTSIWLNNSHFMSCLACCHG
jgi:hypothetical protein